MPLHETSDKVPQVRLVGKRIRKLRKEHKLTVAALASRIGIQPSDLSRIERGEHRVGLDTLFRVLAEFDLGVSDFFQSIAGEVTPEATGMQPDPESDEEGLYREIEGLIAHHRKRKSARPSESPATKNHLP